MVVSLSAPNTRFPPPRALVSTQVKTSRQKTINAKSPRCKDRRAKHELTQKCKRFQVPFKSSLQLCAFALKALRRCVETNAPRGGLCPKSRLRINPTFFGQSWGIRDRFVSRSKAPSATSIQSAAGIARSVSRLVRVNAGPAAAEQSTIRDFQSSSEFSIRPQLLILLSQCGHVRRALFARPLAAGWSNSGRIL